MNERKLRSLKTAAAKQALSELLVEISKIRINLARALYAFNTNAEPELVDACIYEINALQSRYSFLLRKVKENNADDVRTFYFSKNLESACSPKGGTP